MIDIILSTLYDCATLIFILLETGIKLQTNFGIGTTSIPFTYTYPPVALVPRPRLLLRPDPLVLAVHAAAQGQQRERGRARPGDLKQGIEIETCQFFYAMFKNRNRNIIFGSSPT